MKVFVIDELLVDDSLKKTLEQQGFEVALLPLKNLDIKSVVLSILPDIIVLNLYSPTEDIVNTILSINQNHSVPVIIFAEDQDTDTINRVIKAGVSAYIVDGYDTRRIKTIIDIAIARFQEHQQIKEELKKTKTQLEDRKSVDRAKSLVT